VLAPARAARPFTVPPATGEGASGSGKAASGSPSPPPPAPGPVPDCPLCEGHEDRTPPEVYAVRPDGGPADSPGWLVRVVPNLYPVLTIDGDSPRPPSPARDGEPELFESAPAIGAHEVIVQAPVHAATLSDLTPEQFAAAIGGWQARLDAHSDAAYVHLIVNEGLIAGASLEHTHAQLYALRFVPALIARERERFTAHNTRTMGGCLLCDLLQEEVRRRDRVIAVDDEAVLLAPYAARMPYELQLVPRRHAPSPVDADPGSLALLQEALVRLRSKLGGPPPINLWLRIAPKDAEHFHWHIDILPRLTQLAGLELGAGLGVNVYPPERVAAELRELEREPQAAERTS
jgi:UDPglucose--hexose-1-phosphate uridylyltransferase